MALFSQQGIGRMASHARARQGDPGGTHRPDFRRPPARIAALFSLTFLIISRHPAAAGFPSIVTTFAEILAESERRIPGSSGLAQECRRAFLLRTLVQVALQDVHGTPDPPENSVRVSQLRAFLDRLAPPTCQLPRRNVPGGAPRDENAEFRRITQEIPEFESLLNADELCEFLGRAARDSLEYLQRRMSNPDEIDRQKLEHAERGAALQDSLSGYLCLLGNRQDRVQEVASYLQKPLLIGWLRSRPCLPRGAPIQLEGVEARTFKEAHDWVVEGRQLALLTMAELARREAAFKTLEWACRLLTQDSGGDLAPCRMP